MATAERVSITVPPAIKGAFSVSQPQSRPTGSMTDALEKVDHKTFLRERKKPIKVTIRKPIFQRSNASTSGLKPLSSPPVQNRSPPQTPPRNLSPPSPTVNELLQSADQDKIKTGPIGPQMTYPRSPSQDSRSPRVEEMRYNVPQDGSPIPGAGGDREREREREEREGETDQQIWEKAQWISKLERKIKRSKLDLKIPSNATLSDIKLMYNKINYDIRGNMCVQTLRSVYVAINCVLEEYSGSHPSLGLELDKWSDQVKAMTELGLMDEPFYDVYDEYFAGMEMNSLLQLGLIWFTVMINYSSTQKKIAQQKQAQEEAKKAQQVLQRAWNEAETTSKRGMEVRTMRKDAEERKDKDAAGATEDLAPPEVSEASLARLRRDAKRAALQQQQQQPQDEPETINVNEDEGNKDELDCSKIK